MDLNTNQAKLTFNQPTKKVLTLEARHSRSIEAANIIRSKLTPRLFMPRVPDYQYTAKYQNISKKLKPLLFENGNLRNQEINSKWQKPLREKFAKQLPQCDKNNKTMESNIRLLRRNSRSKSRKTQSKRESKDLKNSLVVALQNLEKPMDMPSIVTASGNVIRNWKKSKLEGNSNMVEESIRYTADDAAGSMRDPLSLNSHKPLSKDKSNSKAQNLTTNINILEKPDSNISINVVNKNSSKSQITKHKSKTNARKQVYDSEIPQIKVSKILKEYSNNETKEATSGTKIGCEVRSEIRKHFKKDALISYCSLNSTNITNSEDLQNIGKSLSTNKNNNMISFIETVTEKEKPVFKPQEQVGISPQTNNDAKRNKEKQAVGNAIKPSVPVNQNISNQGLINNETIKQQTTAKEYIKSANSTVKHPLHGYLNTATNDIKTFQDAVRSSISQIYNCSEMDKSINEDLTNLEMSVESFSKFLLQTYNDITEEELKTNKSLEYLREKAEKRRARTHSSRLETSLLNQPVIEKSNSETVTIIIDAERMPTQYITYKTADILNPNATSDSDKASKISQLPLNSATQNLPNLINKNTNETTNNSRQVHAQLSELNTETQNIKHKEKTKRLRKKLTPVKSKPLVLSMQYPTTTTTTTSSVSYNSYQQNYLKSEETLSISYPNFIYTQARNYDKSYLGPYSSGLHNIDYNNSSAVTNNYNYTHATTDVFNTGRISSNENCTTNLYPARQNFNRLQPHNVINDNSNRFEYHRSFRREPYLTNHYDHHVTDANNIQLLHNFSNSGTTNLPASDNSYMSYT